MWPRSWHRARFPHDPVADTVRFPIDSVAGKQLGFYATPWPMDSWVSPQPNSWHKAGFPNKSLAGKQSSFHASLYQTLFNIWETKDACLLWTNFGRLEKHVSCGQTLRDRRRGAGIPSNSLACRQPCFHETQKQTQSRHYTPPHGQQTAGFTCAVPKQSVLHVTFSGEHKNISNSYISHQFSLQYLVTTEVKTMVFVWWLME